MRFLLIVSLCFLLFSCDNRSKKQKVDDRMKEMQAKEMHDEVRVDSLLKVAYGYGDFKYMKENRLNAIDILNKEYPDLSGRLDSVKNAILSGDY